MKILNFIAITLLVICGINSGIIGIFDKNIIAMLLSNSMQLKVAYIIFGAAAIWVIYHDLKSKL